MPKMGIHGIVLEDAIKKLQLDPDTKSLGVGIEEHMDWAMLGAIGPDLFFWSPDYEIMDTVIDMWKIYKKWSEIYNDCMAPVVWVKDKVVEFGEDVYAAAEDVLPTSSIETIASVLQELRETVDLFKSGIVTGVETLVGTSYSDDFFSGFKPPLQDNKSESSWLWFDMLHYRNTGDFAHNLLKNAGTGTDRVKAYAFGYLSHIATDLVGHPYVNQIVGGPFRLHPHRHVTVENWMDTRLYHERFSENINNTLVTRLGFPNTSQLPTDIRDLLYKTFKDTYQNIPHPTKLSGEGFLTKSQISDTYGIFVEILNIMPNTIVPRPEEPFSNVIELLGEAVQDMFEQFDNFPNPPDPAKGNCSLGDILSFGFTDDSRDCYDNFFEKTGEWVSWVLEVIEWTTLTVVAVIDALAASFGLLPILTILAVIYLIQLGLYEIWRSFRSILALHGYIYPDPDDLDTSHGRNLTTTFQCLIENFKYPRQSKSSDSSHLSCPPSNYEKPITAVAFHPVGDSETSPEDFISQAPFDPQSLERYALASSPEDTRAIHRAGISIGNATDITAWMMKNAAISVNNQTSSAQNIKSILFANWNLDGDRGYGFKTWSAIVPPNGNGLVQEEKYV